MKLVITQHLAPPPPPHPQPHLGSTRWRLKVGRLGFKGVICEYYHNISKILAYRCIQRWAKPVQLPQLNPPTLSPSAAGWAGAIPDRLVFLCCAICFHTSQYCTNYLAEFVTWSSILGMIFSLCCWVWSVRWNCFWVSLMIAPHSDNSKFFFFSFCWIVPH